jgi:hypothetical protein
LAIKKFSSLSPSRLVGARRNRLRRESIAADSWLRCFAFARRITIHGE